MSKPFLHVEELFKIVPIIHEKWEITEGGNDPLCIGHKLHLLHAIFTWRLSWLEMALLIFPERLGFTDRIIIIEPGYVQGYLGSYIYIKNLVKLFEKVNKWPIVLFWNKNIFATPAKVHYVIPGIRALDS